MPIDVSAPKQEKTEQASYWRWLHRLWYRATQDGQIKASQLSPDGTPGSVPGIDEDGAGAWLSVIGANGISVSVDGTVLTIAIDEATMDQLNRTNQLLELIGTELRVTNQLLKAGMNVADDVEKLRTDEARDIQKE